MRSLAAALLYALLLALPCNGFFLHDNSFGFDMDPWSLGRHRQPGIGDSFFDRPMRHRQRYVPKNQEPKFGATERPRRQRAEKAFDVLVVGDELGLESAKFRLQSRSVPFHRVIDAYCKHTGIELASCRRLLSLQFQGRPVKGDSTPRELNMDRHRNVLEAVRKRGKVAPKLHAASRGGGRSKRRNLENSALFPRPLRQRSAPLRHVAEARSERKVRPAAEGGRLRSETSLPVTLNEAAKEHALAHGDNGVFAESDEPLLEIKEEPEPAGNKATSRGALKQVHGEPHSGYWERGAFHFF